MHNLFPPCHVYLPLGPAKSCCRYDLAQVDTLEAFAAEGLATFGGCLPDEATTKHFEDMLLAAMGATLGYRGKSMLLESEGLYI